MDDSNSDCEFIVDISGASESNETSEPTSSFKVRNVSMAGRGPEVHLRSFEAFAEPAELEKVVPSSFVLASHGAANETELPNFSCSNYHYQAINTGRFACCVESCPLADDSDA
jgi:hypothetical protein